MAEDVGSGWNEAPPGAKYIGNGQWATRTGREGWNRIHNPLTGGSRLVNRDYFAEKKEEAPKPAAPRREPARARAPARRPEAPEEAAPPAPEDPVTQEERDVITPPASGLEDTVVSTPTIEPPPDPVAPEKPMGYQGKSFLTRKKKNEGSFLTRTRT